MTKEKYKGPRVTDTETFIKKARWVHGDKYDYGEVGYVNKVTKVKIVCREHGEFYQWPGNHCNHGQGCPKCSGKKVVDKISFIAEASKLHSGKYDYSEVDYVNSQTKVKIQCPLHGEFGQVPNSHLSGRGCPYCGGTKKSNLDEFVEKAIKKYGHRFDYSESNYETNKSTISIVCKRHGLFFTTPDHHLSKNTENGGCQSCRYEQMQEKTRKDTSWFVHKAKEVHGDKYDYTKSEYVLGRKKLSIICVMHGEFIQEATSHLQGHGCPDCSLENSGWGQSGYYGTSEPSNIYILKMDNSFIKVGLSRDVRYRMYKIQQESKYTVEKVRSFAGKANDLFELEQKILRRSGLKRFYPEASFGGQSECLEMSELPKVLKIIEQWEKEQAK